ncbi:cytochrome c oxidase subunit 6B1 isoform X2 [Microplitis demolitor]|uniref:cytochrome c oxidase subunit 6B1 isoform X2 n=1 Tax=Microplitis demolitor TaxID=69319 RepID=UPI0004CCBC62|nr:cytochrome c oxidase subunit 6B1 isoform X2 [Microplitis demolitor]
MAYGGIPEDIENYQSAPYDPRFPNTNQTRHCYQYYLDFHRCKKVRGEEYEACKYFKRIYTIMCPKVWTEKWDEQIAEGRFPGRI